MRGLLISILVLAVQSLAWAENHPPVANAGLDRNIYTGDPIILNGAAVDPDGDPIVSWMWSLEQSPPDAIVQLDDATSPSPTFAAWTVGDYLLALVVCDPYTCSNPDFVTVHVADNQPPVAVVTVDVNTITVGGTVCFDGSGSYDPEGGPLIMYRWDFGDGSPPVFDTNTCHVFNSVGTFDVTLIVVDERNASDSNFVTIYVQPPENWPPVAYNQNVWCDGSSPLSGQLTGYDQDGDPLTFNPATPPENGIVVIEPNGVFVYTPNTSWDGSDLFGFTVSDGNYVSNEAFVNLYVFNRPPVADAGRDRYAYTGQSVILEGSATDPEDDPIVSWLWSLEQSPVNAVVQLDGATLPNPTFTAWTVGDYVLALVLCDPYTCSAPDRVLIRVVDVNCRIGDLTGNCLVDIEDLDMLCEQWLKPADCFGQAGCPDLIRDYFVNFDDFAELARDWGI